MIHTLVEYKKTIAKTARGVFSLENVALDERSTSRLARRTQMHEKTAWVLHSQPENCGDFLLRMASSRFVTP